MTALLCSLRAKPRRKQRRIFTFDSRVLSEFRESREESNARRVASRPSDRLRTRLLLVLLTRRVNTPIHAPAVARTSVVQWFAG